MTILSGAVSVLCCSMFTASVIKLIVPSGKTEKILKLVISLFVLICLTTCIKSVADEIKTLDKNDLSYTEISDSLDTSVNENVLKLTGDYMVSYIENLLVSEKIEYSEIKVTVDTDERGVINIKDICIYIDKRNVNINKASTLIEDDLKITPRVVFGE